MYIDIDISEEEYSAFILYCSINKINPKQLLKNYILSILDTPNSKAIYKDKYTESYAAELDDCDSNFAKDVMALFKELNESIGAEVNRKCKKCGKINIHRLNSACDGEWEDI